jgi:glutamate/tyrosine decarboxylase-like PLP-dependent enzyme
MAAQATYVTYATDARDQMDWNPEWSRRARGFATYAAIRELGRTGIAALVERTCRHARDLVTRIGDLPGVEHLGEAQVNQGLVRFLDPTPHALEADHDGRTEAMIEAINQTGEAFFTGTTWRGRRCMRISVSGWRTTDNDVDRAVAAVERCLDNIA